MILPRPPTGLGDLVPFCRELYDYLSSREDVSSPNTLLTRTTRGTSRSSLAGEGGIGESTEIQFKGQWVATTSYFENDLVRCDTTGERNDGRQAGFYRCIAGITGNISNAHPSADATHWVMEARGHWDKLVIRAGNRQIELDTTASKIKLYDITTTTPGSVTIDLNDIPVDATDKEIKFREIMGKDTESGGCWKMVVLGSAWYA
jgi:hypothetical protein